MVELLLSEDCGGVGADESVSEVLGFSDGLDSTEEVWLVSFAGCWVREELDDISLDEELGLSDEVPEEWSIS